MSPWNLVFALIALASTRAQLCSCASLFEDTSSPAPSSSLQIRSQGPASCVHRRVTIQYVLQSHLFTLSLPGTIWQAICSDDASINLVFDSIRKDCRSEKQPLVWASKSAHSSPPSCELMFYFVTNDKDKTFPDRHFDTSCFLANKPCADINLSWPTACVGSLSLSLLFITVVAKGLFHDAYIKEILDTHRRKQLGWEI